MVANNDHSLIVWPGMSDTTGALLTAVTVNTAGSLSDSNPGSVAVNTIVSLPFQLGPGTVTVARFRPRNSFDHYMADFL